MSEKTNSGLARAQKLTPARRKEISSAAIKARWEKQGLMENLPKVIIKRNPLTITDVTIPCAIVEMPNGEIKRVLTDHGITNAILGAPSGASKRLKNKALEDGAVLPLFIAPERLKPFIDKELSDGALNAIEYVDNGKIVVGYDARLLPAVCDVWLKARDAGVLQDQQLDKAKKAEILMRALAHVGIIALVDEATGYQDIRPRDALAKILEAYVAAEMRPWVKRFPAEFYKEMFRLRGLEFKIGNIHRPQYFGHLTNDIIYRRLAPGVWKELKRVVDKDDNGRAKNKLFQHLSDDIGDPKLQRLVTKVLTIMELSDNWNDFKIKLDRLVPAYGDTLSLPFMQKADDGIGL
jgi:P63C domain